MNLLWAFILLFASIPIGHFLKSLTKEEIKPGKKYFKIFWISCLVLSVGLLFTNIFEPITKQAMIFTLLFMANVGFISWK